MTKAGKPLSEQERIRAICSSVGVSEKDFIAMRRQGGIDLGILGARGIPRATTGPRQIPENRQY